MSYWKCLIYLLKSETSLVCSKVLFSGGFRCNDSNDQNNNKYGSYITHVIELL